MTTPDPAWSPCKYAHAGAHSPQTCIPNPDHTMREDLARLGATAINPAYGPATLKKAQLVVDELIRKGHMRDPSKDVAEVAPPVASTPDTPPPLTDDAAWQWRASMIADMLNHDTGWCDATGDEETSRAYFESLAETLLGVGWRFGTPDTPRVSTHVDNPQPATDGIDNPDTRDARYEVDSGPSVYMCGHAEYVIRIKGMPGVRGSFYARSWQAAEAIERLLNEAAGGAQ